MANKGNETWKHYPDLKYKAKCKNCGSYRKGGQMFDYCDLCFQLLYLEFVLERDQY
jgi:hypothetical protein